MAGDAFDPYAILAALDRNRVSFVVIGGIARVVRGTDEITSDVDICPNAKPENLRRLERAIEELEGAPAPSADPLVREYATPVGNVSVVEQPTGIRGGYDGLRRQAEREALGQRVRVSVAGVPDLLRNLEAMGREFDVWLADQLRTMVELERSLGLDLDGGIGR